MLSCLAVSHEQTFYFIHKACFLRLTTLNRVFPSRGRLGFQLHLIPSDLVTERAHSSLLICLLVVLLG